MEGLKSSKCMQYFSYLGRRMVRQKEVDQHDMKTELRRCLSTPQLALLGVGSTIGVGIYVLLGVIVKDNAGPSTVLCFLAAIIVTFLNAMVYAEFSSYVPQTGAGYLYIYKIIGEYPAFLSGWVMIIVSSLSGSVGARAWSGMVDSFFNHTIQEYTIHTFGKIEVGMPFAESLDILAFVFQLVIIVIVSFNVVCSSIINMVLGILTTSVLIFVFGAGLIYGDVKNLVGADHGGFFPFGITGVVKGASLALYATSGFEIISVSAEEAKNPSKAVPRAIMYEFLIVGTVYILAAVGILFLIPYWLVDLRAPLPSAFEYNGLTWGKYIVTIGPLFGITNLQMLGLYGCSRILYRMSADGLFFSCFVRIHKSTGVPRNSVFFMGSLVSVMALVCDLSYIVKFTVLLMLFGYLILGSALIKLRTRTGDFSQLSDTETTDEKYRMVKLKSVDEFYDHEIPIDKDEAESLNGDAINHQGLHSQSPCCEYDIGTSELSQVTDLVDTDAQQSPSRQSDIQLKVGENDDTSIADTPLQNFDQSVDTATNGAALCDEFSPSEAEVLSRQTKNSFVSFFVPRVLSVNSVLVIHGLCCVTIALQVNFGWEDIVTKKAVAVLAMTLMLLLLTFFSVLIWMLCWSSSSSGFQTPLMPLIPTLSMLTTSVLLFAAGEVTGLIEMAVILATGSVAYMVLVLSDYRAECRGDQDKSSGVTEESRALMDESAGDADDEIETGDEF